MSKEYYLVKHGLFYRPEGQGGLTDKISEAGKFTEEEVRIHETISCGKAKRLEARQKHRLWPWCTWQHSRL